MRPGDGLFFHGNLVHGSGPDDAGHERWLPGLSCNGVSNAPVFDVQEPHAVNPMDAAPVGALRDGRFNGAFGRMPLQDPSDPHAAGASIRCRDDFPDRSGRGGRRPPPPPGLRRPSCRARGKAGRGSPALPPPSRAARPAPG